MRLLEEDGMQYMCKCRFKLDKEQKARFSLDIAPIHIHQLAAAYVCRREASVTTHYFFNQNEILSTFCWPSS